MLFTDNEDGRYFAPFAYMGGQPSKQALMDMKYVIDNGEVPDHIIPITQEHLIGVRRQIKPYAQQAVSEMKRALDQREGVDIASNLLEQYFATNPRQAVDLYEVLMNKKDDRETIESLSNNTLIQLASANQDPMTGAEKARVLRQDFVEALSNRCQ